jgi:hypothetical protein
MKIDPSQCHDMECTYCGCDTFVDIMKMKAVPILLLPPQGATLRDVGTYCTACQLELDLERSKRWAALTPEKRAEARHSMLKALKEKDEKSKKKTQ